MINTDDCWHWAGYSDKYGYGKYSYKDPADNKWKTGAAHRLSYEHHVGEIPAGLVIDHLCRVTCCINPNHLEAVTNSENVKRGLWGKLRVLVTHCKQGHEYTEANTIISFQKRVGRDRRICRACSNKNSLKWHEEQRQKKRKLELG